MIVNVRFNLSEVELKKLGLLWNGKKPATRKEVGLIVNHLLAIELADAGAKTLVNAACPKCNKAIGVTVPIVNRKLPATDFVTETKTKPAPKKWDIADKKLATSVRDAAVALEKLAKLLSREVK